jgi:excisionase family DNA binding protein
MAIEPVAYRVSEIAAMLRISRTSAYQLVLSGELPSFKLAGMLRVPASAVRKLLDDKIEARD